MSIIIASFVLYVLISLLLENKRRENGILKALGFVTKEIVYQVELSIIPISIIATVIGLLVSRKGSGNLVTMLIQDIGIFRFGEATNFIYLFISGLGLIIFTILFIMILSRPIKKISPHELFNRE